MVGVDVEVQARARELDADQRGSQVLAGVFTISVTGGRDLLIACCDGLTGLLEAITTIFPETIVQTCVVHLLRNAMRFVPTATGRNSPAT